MKIFWSWQFDHPGKTGHHFVREALQEAIEQVKSAVEYSEPTYRGARPVTLARG